MELLTIDHPLIKENKNNLALTILTKARENYLRQQNKYGMCHVLYEMLYSIFPLHKYEFNENFIDILIPEFNRKYLNAQYSHWSEDVYYWDISDIQSRLKAFDKLINLYTNKLNNHEIK